MTDAAFEKLCSEAVGMAKTGDISGLRQLLLDYQKADHINPGLGWRRVLRMTAYAAAFEGQKEMVMCLCNEYRVVACHVPQDEEFDQREIAPFIAALVGGHDDLALELLALPMPPGIDLASARPLPVANKGTVLHAAAGYGALLVVEELVIKHGMDIEEFNDKKCTALDIAAVRLHLPVMRFLLERYREAGRLPRALQRPWFNEDGEPGCPLIYLVTSVACITGDIEKHNKVQLAIVTMLVEEFGADPWVVSTVGPLRQFALHVACVQANLPLVEFFFTSCGEVSADIAVESGTLTPLHYAATSSTIQEDKVLRVVRYLVEERGADISLKTSSGMTATDLAKDHKFLQVYEYLTQKATERKRAVQASLEAESTLVRRLFDVANKGNLSEVQLIIQEHDNKYWESNNGRHVLRLAACQAVTQAHGHIVKFLISSHGVPIHQRPAAFKESTLSIVGHELITDLQFATPLAAALYRDHEDLALELIDLGASVGQRLDLAWPMKNGSTVLHMAAQQGMVRFVQKLLQCGLDALEVMEARNKAGLTPLEASLMRGHVHVVRILIERYEAKGQLQRALLRRWAKGDEYHMALLVWVVAIRSDTAAIDEACRLAVVRFLVTEKKADVRVLFTYVLGKRRATLLPLHLAATSGHRLLVQFFVDECQVPADAAFPPLQHTALHCVAMDTFEEEEDQLRMIKLLVSKGADVRARTGEGDTAADFAKRGGRPRVAEYLSKIEKELVDAATAALLADLQAEDEVKEKKTQQKKNKSKGKGGNRDGQGGGGQAAGRKEKQASDGGTNVDNAPAAVRAEEAMGRLQIADDEKEDFEEEKAPEKKQAAAAAKHTTPPAKKQGAAAAAKPTTAPKKEKEASAAPPTTSAEKKEDAAPSTTPPPPPPTTIATTFEEFALEGANESYVCPIGFCLMTEPVVCLDGFTYQRSSIAGWFETCKLKGQPLSSPKTNDILPADFLLPNKTLKVLVGEWIEQKKRDWAVVEEERRRKKESEEEGQAEGKKGKKGKGKK